MSNLVGDVPAHPFQSLFDHRDATRAGPRRDQTYAGRSTRSSRWMTSWAMPGGQVARVVAGDAAQLGGLDEHHPAGERHAVGAGDVDGVAGGEAARHVDDAGRQQARLALDERPAGAVVDGDRARRPGTRTRSTACAPTACGGGPRTSCRPARRRSPRPARAARAALAMTVRTPDHDAIRAASSFEPSRRSPARCRRCRRGSPAAGRRCGRGSRAGRPRRHAGRRCTGRRGRSAARARRQPMLWPTRAAMRSLSP